MSSCNCQAGNSHLTAAKVGTLERPRYSPGLILQDADLTAAVDYTRELNRLLFRSLFGCGVICGYEVSLEEECGLQVRVSPGLGLDGNGDPLHLTGQAAIELGKRDGVIERDQEPPSVKNFWVIACNRERMCAPRSVVCDGDELDSTRQTTRVRSGVEISISFEPPNCVCGCGIFSNKPGEKALDNLANSLRNVQRSPNGQFGTTELMEPCFDAQRNDPDCPEDCDCGGSCNCGCCVLLAWAHWFPPEPSPAGDRGTGGWKALHYGVRRFVRPRLVPDPRPDYKTTDPNDGQPAIDEETRRSLEDMVRTQYAGTLASVEKDAEPGKEIDRDAIASAARSQVIRALRNFDIDRIVEFSSAKKPAAKKPAAKRPATKTRSSKSS